MEQQIGRHYEQIQRIDNVISRMDQDETRFKLERLSHAMSVFASFDGQRMMMSDFINDASGGHGIGNVLWQTRKSMAPDYCDIIGAGRRDEVPAYWECAPNGLRSCIAAMVSHGEHREKRTSMSTNFVYGIPSAASGGSQGVFRFGRVNMTDRGESGIKHFQLCMGRSKDTPLYIMFAGVLHLQASRDDPQDPIKLRVNPLSGRWSDTKDQLYDMLRSKKEIYPEYVTWAETEMYKLANSDYNIYSRCIDAYAVLAVAHVLQMKCNEGVRPGDRHVVSTACLLPIAYDVIPHRKYTQSRESLKDGMCFHDVPKAIDVHNPAGVGWGGGGVDGGCCGSRSRSSKYGSGLMDR